MNAFARLLAALTLTCAGAASTAAAEGPAAPYIWRNVVIGGGGFSPNVIFSPAEKGLAYLRTDVGGAYRWDDAQQRWIPLEDALPTSSYFGIESIAPDPKNPDVVYLAAGMYYRDPTAAILRSGDRGRTWRITEVPFKMGGNEDGRGMGERLAIDPNQTSTLFFGSRHDGLWRSQDSGSTWQKVDSFPWSGLGAPQPRHTHGGVSFVVFDPASGRPGAASRIIYAGVADPAPSHLFRSSDGGKTWAAVPGQPDPTLLPVKAAVDSRGVLYIDYCTAIGPSGIDAGAVWALNSSTGAWRDVSPVRGDEAEGGYMGLSIDPGHAGRVAVSTVDRWNHGDTVWLSNDGGGHWTSLRERSNRDVSGAPFLKFGRPEAPFGHWISGLALDPFDAGTLAYTTGDSVYRTKDGLKGRLLWKPWVRGVEETVPLSLASPTAGAHLISGIGDVHGFVHDRLDTPPAAGFLNPDLPNTNNVDYAGLAPNIVVRSASYYEPSADGVSLGWSDDGGHKWRELMAPAVAVGDQAEARIDTNGEAPMTVSADGKTFVVSGPVLLATADRGRTWWQPRGLPHNVRAFSDKADPLAWYAVDYATSAMYVSRDGAHSFARVPASGLPADISDVRPRSREMQLFMVARPGTAGELWFMTGWRLYRSTDFGRSFKVMTSADRQWGLFGLGKAAPGSAFPTLFALAVKPAFGGVWRSIDGGASWVRVNDDEHQWGFRYREIAGDPRVFGRVYVGTDGRGILYGDPAPGTPLR